MRLRRVPTFAIALSCALLWGCGGPSHDGSEHSHHGSVVDGLSTELSTARATGTVMSVGELGDFLTLDHDEIPEINMGAMRMGFDVADGVDVSTLAPGDEVLFDMEMSDAIGVRVTAICTPARDGANCLGD